uniref:Knr4/Smi1-like domain-containing protein n=1 Tax=Ananas comosus var. bracteatus TaxID=296719 RepID=A0A6V7Q340_ANACO|nr:unnamed protein product [Ananas comosus var. bracteatus]
MTTTTTKTTTTTTKQPETLARNPRACFSVAAYAKAVVVGLVGGGAAVDAGLTAAELAAIEASLGFSFPPDLRALLAEALPISPGFPNWRSPSSSLLLLLRRPLADLLLRADRARETLDRAPILVPIYRRYYVPASPALAGNPVFHVRAGEVRVAAVDIADFFARWGSGAVVAAAAAAWGGKREEARRVEVWTEMAEEEAGTCGRGEAARAVERGLVEMGARLREAGWGRRRCGR